MDEKVTQLIRGAKVEFVADHVYVTGTGLILIIRNEDLKLWKMIYTAQVYDKDHVISIITTPRQSIMKFDMKEEI